MNAERTHSNAPTNLHPPRCTEGPRASPRPPYHFPASAMPPRNRRPNVVLFESDSMDGRVMACAGHPAAYTPNLDKLAARGVLFQEHVLQFAAMLSLAVEHVERKTHAPHRRMEQPQRH